MSLIRLRTLLKEKMLVSINVQVGGIGRQSSDIFSYISVYIYKYV